MPDTNTANNLDSIRSHTATIVSAFFANPNSQTDATTVAGLIQNTFAALSGLGSAPAAPEIKQEPKVAIRSSIKPDYIVCLEDGKKLKMLKRHLMTHYQMTPDQYRAKWGLNADYPMVAPNYAETRRALAKAIGLGTTRRKAAPTATASEATATKAAPKAARRGRRKANAQD